MERALTVKNERGRYKKTRNRSERNQKISRHVENARKTYHKDKTTIFLFRETSYGNESSMVDINKW